MFDELKSFYQMAGRVVFYRRRIGIEGCKFFLTDSWAPTRARRSPWLLSALVDERIDENSRTWLEVGAVFSGGGDFLGGHGQTLSPIKFLPIFFDSLRKRVIDAALRTQTRLEASLFYSGQLA